jgi:uncharacterized protein (TIGR02466 family)
MKNVKTINAFPTLIQSFDLNEGNHCADLINFLKKQKTIQINVIDKGVNTFNHDLLREPELENLRTKIKSAINVYAQTAGIQFPLVITNSWANVLKKGGKVKIHSHRVSVISGAFYPTASSEVGSICFKNPVSVYHQLYGGDQNIQDPDTENPFDPYSDVHYLQWYMKIKPTPGLLILFPSWLEHWTTENKSNERITLSFNTNYKPYIPKEINIKLNANITGEVMKRKEFNDHS